MPIWPAPDQNDPVVRIDGQVFMVSSTLFFRDEKSGDLFDIVHVLRGYIGRRIRLTIHLLGSRF